MALKLGMPTLIEMPDIEPTIRLCQKLGLDFIELNMNMPEFCPESMPAKRLSQITNDTGIGFSIHMPDDTDLASFHDSIRAGHLQRFGETARWAAEAGAKLINLHLSPGIFFTLPDTKVWVYERYYEKFIGNLVEAYGKIIDYAHNCDLLVCTENVINFNIPFIARAIDDLCELKDFYLTWDIGHDARTGYMEKEVLMRHEDRIKHLHLHDYNGVSDHQVPFTGSIDIMAALDFARRRRATVLVEVKNESSLIESVHRVRARI